MVHLKNNISAKKRILDTALRTSSQATHLARQLIEGVVKPEFLLPCTMTGNPPRGKKNNNVLPLHGAAKDPIVAYAKETAVAKQWKFLETKILEKAMRQKLTELRIQINKNEQH